MNPDQELEAIELSIEEAKDKIAKAAALDRLHDNIDFKKVFLNDFLTDRVVRLTRLQASQGNQDERVQKYIANQLNASAHMYQYMVAVTQEGLQAKHDLESAYEEQTTIMGGEV